MPIELCGVIMKNFEFGCLNVECENTIPLSALNTMTICNNTLHRMWEVIQAKPIWQFYFFCVCNEHKDKLIKCADCDYLFNGDDYEDYPDDTECHCNECGRYLCKCCTILLIFSSDDEDDDDESDDHIDPMYSCSRCFNNNTQ